MLRKLRIHLIKETFSMFLGHYSFKTGKVTTSFLGIKNWKDKAVGEIVEIVINVSKPKRRSSTKHFWSFYNFIVLDGTNSMSGTKRGLQRWIRFYYLFNLYVSCRNYHLALCLFHLTKDSELGQLQIDYDAFAGCMESLSLYSEEFYSWQYPNYGKKHLEIIKAAITSQIIPEKAS